LNADEKTNLASELKKIKKFNIIGISLFVITIIIVGAAGESNTTDPNLALALVAFFGFIIGALLSLISSFKKSTIKKKYQLSGYEMKELLKNGVN
jgi:nitrate reductase NapE component